jgi:hypothetical protein
MLRIANFPLRAEVERTIVGVRLTRFIHTIRAVVSVLIVRFG